MLTSSVSLKKQRLRPGQVVRVELGSGQYALALTLNEPLMAFLDRKFSSDDTSSIDVSNAPIAFVLMVMNYAVTSGRWPIVEKAEIPSSLRSVPKFCKQDQISGKLSIYHEVPELAPNYERSAKPGECAGLETAAVWDPEHVEDRLRDHFAGVPNKWVQQLSIAP